MTKTAEKIIKLADQLTPDAQEHLLHVAEHLAATKSFYGQMSKEQHLELDQAINEANEGRAVSPAELQLRLERTLSKYGS